MPSHWYKIIRMGIKGIRLVAHIYIYIYMHMFRNRTLCFISMFKIDVAVFMKVEDSSVRLGRLFQAI
jgi:hypothetical protein